MFPPCGDSVSFHFVLSSNPRQTALFQHGIFRIQALAPPVKVANPIANTDTILDHMKGVEADLTLFPELALSGYTCGDLFATQSLLRASLDGLSRIADASSGRRGIIVVGLPLVVGDSLMNVAAVGGDGGRSTGWDRCPKVLTDLDSNHRIVPFE